MVKTLAIFLFIIVLLFLSSCIKDTSPIKTGDTPDWLNNYIENIKDDPSYIGTIIYRYNWKGNFVYYIMIPISSCAYCDVYYHSGEKIVFDNNMLHDFMNNKKNEFIVWKWKE